MIEKASVIDTSHTYRFFRSHVSFFNLQYLHTLNLPALFHII